MKETPMTQAVQKAVDIKMRAIDVIIKDIIGPLQDLGNPEKVIGKPYDQWTSEDIGWLTRVYGTKEPNILSNFIFRKEKEEVKRLEREVGSA
jgi:hypothetical protein